MEEIVKRLEQLLNDYYRSYFLFIGFMLGSELMTFIAIVQSWR